MDSVINNIRKEIEEKRVNLHKLDGYIAGLSRVLMLLENCSLDKKMPPESNPEGQSLS